VCFQPALCVRFGLRSGDVVQVWRGISLLSDESLLHVSELLLQLWLMILITQII